MQFFLLKIQLHETRTRYYIGPRIMKINGMCVNFSAVEFIRNYSNTHLAVQVPNGWIMRQDFRLGLNPIIISFPVCHFVFSKRNQCQANFAPR